MLRYNFNILFQNVVNSGMGELLTNIVFLCQQEGNIRRIHGEAVWRPVVVYLEFAFRL